MKEKRDCQIVQDLLPNYIEKLTNEETNLYIEEHLNECDDCKNMLENMQKGFKENNKKREIKEIEYIKVYNDKMRTLKFIIIIILAIALTIMTYYYFYMRNAYFLVASEMVKEAENLEKLRAQDDRSIENVNIEVVMNSITSSGATIIVTDNNENKYPWKEDYVLQIKENDSWKDVKKITDINFNQMDFVFNGNNKMEQKIDWSKSYGILSKGTYKILKPVDTILEYITFDSNEFEIK